MDAMESTVWEDGVAGTGQPPSAEEANWVVVTLDETDRLLLERNFDVEDIDETANRIAQIAFREWLGWMAGTRRYNSTSDQAMERIIDIYSEVMPDQEPEVSFLYNRLSIPYGRSRYIVQAIVNRQLHALNRRAWERLVATLDAKMEELRQYSASERRVLLEIRFVLDVRAEKLLTSIIEQMPLAERPVSSFKRIPSPLPNTREYSLEPGDLEPLLQAVRDFRL